MMDDNLVFRRQFLLTPDTCASLSHWGHTRVGNFHVYAHPDVELSTVQSADGTAALALVGFIIDPVNRESSNVDVLNAIADLASSVDRVSEYLCSLSGRFVLVLTNSEDTFLFHDPCGLRTLYYTRHEGQVLAGSQPLIFKEVMPLEEGARFASYFGSAYVRADIEHWLPSGCSLYEAVHHLIPNHYLRFSTLEQTRYWPNRPISERRADEVVAEAADLLQRLIVAGSHRFKLALPLTAGWDSRVLLAASRRISPEVYFYTLQYRDLASTSDDIRIPRRLLRSLSCRHNLIDCRKPVSDEFRATYQGNTSMSHMDDWGSIASGMADAYPADRVCMKGNCSEIARCFYYPSGRHDPITSADQLVALEAGWREIGFACDQVSVWFDAARPVSGSANIDILDLFYMEHRMGSWQAQSQLEWDIVQETFTPYNHRGLLEVLLSAPAALRSAPDYRLYGMICKAMWPQVMKLPVNPPAGAKSPKVLAKRALRRMGIYDVARSVYRRVRSGGRQAV